MHAPELGLAKLNSTDRGGCSRLRIRGFNRIQIRTIEKDKFSHTLHCLRQTGHQARRRKMGQLVRRYLEALWRHKTSAYSTKGILRIFCQNYVLELNLSTMSIFLRERGNLKRRVYLAEMDRFHQSKVTGVMVLTNRCILCSLRAGIETFTRVQRAQSLCRRPPRSTPPAVS